MKILTLCSHTNFSVNVFSQRVTSHVLVTAATIKLASSPYIPLHFRTSYGLKTESQNEAGR
jgi:HD-like signal output (HDOD) protein